MNDEDLKNLERQLERATAAESPTDAVPDEETKALRETWLSLTSLLETVTRPALNEPFELQLPRVRPNGRLLIGVVAMVAASLLAAVALGWHLLGSERTASPTAPANQIVKPNQIIEPDQIAKPAPKSTQPAMKQAVAKSNGSQLDWDDSLDQQLVSAGREMVRVQQDWHGLDNAFAPLQHGLEQMRQDIKNDQL